MIGQETQPRDPRAALISDLGTMLAIAWAFLVPLDPILSAGPGAPGASHALAIPLVVLGFLWFARKRTPKYAIIFLFFIFAFLGSGLLHSIDPRFSARRTISLIYYLFLLLSIYSFFALRTEKAPAFLVAFALGVLVSSSYGWFFYYDPPMRLTILPGYNPTHLAAMLATSVLIYLFLLARTPSLVTKVLYGAGIILAGYFLIRTVGQTALYSLLFAIVAGGAWVFKRNIKALLSIAIGFSLSLWLVFSFGILEDTRIERTIGLVETGDVASDDGLHAATTGRSSIWRDLLVMQNLGVVGVGWGNANKLSTTQQSPHNNYLTVLLEGGLIGFSLFIALLGYAWYMVRGLSFSTISVVFFSVFMFGNDMLHYKYAWIAVTSFAVIFLIERQQMRSKDISSQPTRLPSAVRESRGFSLRRERGRMPGVGRLSLDPVPPWVKKRV